MNPVPKQQEALHEKLVRKHAINKTARKKKCLAQARSNPRKCRPREGGKKHACKAGQAGQEAARSKREAAARRKKPEKRLRKSSKRQR